MEPHEIKARSLVLSFLGFMTWEQAKQAAVITVAEILILGDAVDAEFWRKVDDTIKKL